MKNYLQLLLPVFICPFQGFFSGGCNCHGQLRVQGTPFTSRFFGEGGEVAQKAKKET